MNGFFLLAFVGIVAVNLWFMNKMADAIIAIFKEMEKHSRVIGFMLHSEALKKDVQKIEEECGAPHPKS